MAGYSYGTSAPVAPTSTSSHLVGRRRSIMFYSLIVDVYRRLNRRSKSTPSLYYIKITHAFTQVLNMHNLCECIGSDEGSDVILWVLRDFSCSAQPR